jgi:type I restriction enzyme S subunit
MSDLTFERVELGDVADRSAGSFVDGPFGSSLKSDEYTEEGVRLIQLQNIGINEWFDANQKFISERKFLSLQRHGAVPGDIAIAKMAEPVARACIVPPVSERFVVVADCIRLRPDASRFVPSYIAKAINSPYTRLEAEKKAIGSTRIRINLTTLKTVGCLIPSFERQSKIAEILDTMDAAIRGTEAVVAKLKAMKQGLLHDLLTRGIDANGDLRPPQPEASHLYKQTPLGWLPKEWETPFLDNVAQRGSGHTPSKSIASYWNGGIKWVSLADSHRLDQVYIHETDKEISEAGLANSSAVQHPENTVILSRDAGIGKSAILASEMAVSQHFIAWRCGAKLNHTFLYYVLQRAKPKFEAIAMGSTIKTIGLSFFKKYKIALPPELEQDQSAKILIQTEGDINRHEQELRKLKSLKSGLIDDLLTGRVSVTPLL